MHSKHPSVPSITFLHPHLTSLFPSSPVVKRLRPQTPDVIVGLSIMLSRLLVEKGGADVRAVAKVLHEPLHVACLGNWGLVVRYLLTEAHADVEAADKNGKRPLYLAVEANKLDSVAEVLRHG